jgi:hypothetical protein
VVFILFTLIFKNIIYLDNATIIPPGDTCDNDGVRDPTTKICNCPSGFIGSRCEIQKGISIYIFKKKLIKNKKKRFGIM